MLVDASTSYGCDLLRGIHAYSREHDNWSIHRPHREYGDVHALGLSDDWRGDGIIARIINPRMVAQLRKRRGRIPIIDLCSSRMLPATPSIEVDHAAAAWLAVEHFTERGFHHFGYFGPDTFRWASEFRKSFVAALAAVRHTCEVFSTPLATAGRKPDRLESALSQWITSLPTPVGILASNDFRAWQVLEICRRAHIAVPDEVAVMGLDNDLLLSGLSDPPLTSIALHGFHAGYLGAKSLDDWMNGKPPQFEHQLIKPLSVITRKSTDVVAVADANVSAAVRFIRERACQGIQVEDVLDAVPLSRTALDAEFRKLFGRTAYEEIKRVQFQRVIELLTETDLSLAQIAHRTGFSHAAYMTYAFKERYGTPPRDFRKKHKSGNPVPS